MTTASLEQSRQQTRRPWTIFVSVVSAIFLKELRQKFIHSANTRRSLGFIWIFIQPMLMVGLWLIIRTLYGFKAPGQLPTVMFILLGAMPYIFLRNALQNGMKLIKNNKALFQYRQIKPPDILLAQTLLETCITIAVTFILLVAYWWFGIHWKLYYPLFLLVNIISYVIFCYGVGMTLAAICFFFPIIQQFSTVFIRLLYYTSGVFFGVSMIPQKFLPIFIYNPLFQIINITREAFTNVPPPIHVTYPIYLFKCAIVALFLGLILFMSLKRRIMTQINQR